MLVYIQCILGHFNELVYFSVQRLPSFPHSSKINYRTTFNFDHLPTHVPKSPHCLQDSESAIISAHLLEVWLLQTCLSQKSPKFGSFLFESILKLDLWNIKSKFSLKLLVFLGHDMKLDGVGPVDNRPSTDKLHHFVRKKKIIINLFSKERKGTSFHNMSQKDQKF